VGCLHGVWRARSRRRERDRAARPAICRRICPREMLFPSRALAHVRRAHSAPGLPPPFTCLESGARRIKVARRGGATSGRFFAGDRAATKKVSSTWRAEARRAEAGSGGRGPARRGRERRPRPASAAGAGQTASATLPASKGATPPSSRGGRVQCEAADGDCGWDCARPPALRRATLCMRAPTVPHNCDTAKVWARVREHALQGVGHKGMSTLVPHCLPSSTGYVVEEKGVGDDAWTSTCARKRRPEAGRNGLQTTPLRAHRRRDRVGARGGVKASTAQRRVGVPPTMQKGNGWWGCP